MERTTPKPPAHLRKRTREWWAGVLVAYELEPHHIRLLTLAAESWDRCEEARQVLRKEGLVFEDRFGQPKARPEVAIERDSRIAFARMLRELALDVEGPADDSRPPSLAGRAHLKREG